MGRRQQSRRQSRQNASTGGKIKGFGYKASPDSPRYIVETDEGKRAAHKRERSAKHIHPALTDVPLGAWTVALVFDVMAEGKGRKEYARAAETAVAIGLVGAIGAAATGMTDWSETGGRARRVGLMHGLLNAGSTALYGASLLLRRRGQRRAGRNLAYLGYAISMTSAYIGGHLVFNERIGVDRPAQ